MTKKEAWTIIRFEFPYVHKHPEAVGDVEYLQHSHRILARCEVQIERFGTEKDAEPIATKDWLLKLTGELTEDQDHSIEMIADLIKINIDKVYLGSRKVNIRVMESEDIGILKEYG